MNPLSRCLLLLLTLGAPTTWAHTAGTVYIDVLPQTGATPALQVDVPLADIAAALALDANGDGLLRWQEVTSARPYLQRFLGSRLQLRDAAGDCAERLTADPQWVARETGGYLRLLLAFDCVRPTDNAVLDASTWFAREPALSIALRWPDRATAVTLLNAAQPRIALTARPSPAFADFLRLGALHMLTGYDHLAFLALLLLGCLLTQAAGESTRRRILDAAGVVTAFTVAHSLTLALAALGVARISIPWVEFAIAASIGVTALALLLGQARWIRWPVAFSIGLVHGLGFANMLDELLPPDALLVPLAAFNAGLELAQLLVVALCLPVLLMLARWPIWQRRFSQGAALALACLSVLWMLERGAAL